ncbi:hypothetical protein BCR44DRAFT_85564 [Catenaria anguillulae PL171]|uniref:Uncharacterized protein n=1 Tax=Catenaria anguillulae PL171 TaxID=765915 RepID=A0A1Y2HSC4_9FUNG|nr:hypothetical protein BCR44DRAFT_85564 [Catenaria anguillulae PL171]
MTGWSANAHMWSCNSQAEDQNIRFLPSPSLRNGRISGMLQLGLRGDLLALCMDVPGGWFDVGQIIRLWECNGSDAQIFSLVPDAFGDEERFKISPAARPDLCVVVSGGFPAPAFVPNGQGIILERCEALASAPILESKGHWRLLFGGNDMDYRRMRVVPRASPVPWSTQTLNDASSILWDARCDVNPGVCPAPSPTPTLWSCGYYC